MKMSGGPDNLTHGMCLLQILSLRTAIKDRDHELKVLSEEIARTKADLEAAKEEIAVKVAQVKQYQKQVEAYKQQVGGIVILSILSTDGVCMYMYILGTCTGPI